MNYSGLVIEGQPQPVIARAPKIMHYSGLVIEGQPQRIGCRVAFEVDYSKLAIGIRNPFSDIQCRTK